MNTQYQLCFYSGSLTGKIFPIVKEETKIGRDASCDIVLTENSVSRIHVFLYVQQNGSVVLVDNNSTNGTVVNNYQISAPVQLSENDVIGLGGDVMLVFQRVAGYDPGNQLNGTDMPAGNAPDSYNFEKKQGNPMSNENNNLPNDGAANGSVPNSGQDQQQGTENFGFNQSYNAPYGMPGMNQGQLPYGYQTPYDPSGMNAQIPMQSAVPSDNAAQPGAPVSTDGTAPVSADPANNQVPGAPQAAPMYQQPMSFGNDPYAQQMGQQMPYAANPYGQQMPYGGNPYAQPMPYGQPPMGQQQNTFGADPYSQQPPMGQQPNTFGADPYSQQPPMGQQQNTFGADPYSQQPPMGQQANAFGADPYSQQPPMGQQQNTFGADPYSQQPPMGQQQNTFGADPYSQQPPMGQQQNAFGADPYSQQQPMGQQANTFGADPYSQQPPMGQQTNTFGADPYSQQPPMGQQMPFGNNPYGQQMGQQMPYGNDPYGQPMGQQMPYGNNPYGQPMGQQMPYGNDPYAQQPGMGQQMPYGNNPYAQQPGMGQQYTGVQNNQDEEKPKKKKKKTVITLGVILGVLILIGIFIFYVDHNRLWCDVFPFLWDADTCANYMR